MTTYLETDRIILKQFTQNDAQLLVDLDSDPEVIRYTQARVRYGGKPPSIEIFRNEILPVYLSLYEKFPGFGFFAAFEKISDEFLGWFHLIPDGSSRAELGYRLKRKYWRQGLATEVSKALIDNAFRKLGLREIFSGALIANDASIRVMTKCRMKFVKNYHHENGEAVEYGLSVEEWQANQVGMACIIKIALLKNHPNAIPAIANIWHEVLGKIWMPEISIAEIEAGYYEELNEDLPIAYVAFYDETPVGSCSLQLKGGIRPDLEPWLGDLVVAPKYQKQGIGEMLVDAAVKKTKDLGFKKLYLFAFDPEVPEYYKRLGWKKIAMDEFNYHPVTVMETTAKL